MARENVALLDTGDLFPGIEFDTVSGDRVVLPDAFGGKWSLFLVYRGSW